MGWLNRLIGNGTQKVLDAADDYLPPLEGVERLSEREYTIDTDQIIQAGELEVSTRKALNYLRRRARVVDYKVRINLEGSEQSKERFWRTLDRVVEDSKVTSEEAIDGDGRLVWENVPKGMELKDGSKFLSGSGAAVAGAALGGLVGAAAAAYLGYRYGGRAVEYAMKKFGKPMLDLRNEEYETLDEKIRDSDD